jgi:para-nitrobenzyl esterase
LTLLEIAAAAAVVKVDGGRVEGVGEIGLQVYRGIPFAAPPVGDLRWRAPQPRSDPSSGMSANRWFAGLVGNIRSYAITGVGLGRG